MHPFLIYYKFMDITKRPKTHLIQDDITELKDIFYRNNPPDFKSISERADSNKIDSAYGGKRLASVSCSELGEWYKQRWNVVEGRMGGQLAYLQDPLGPHADVIFAHEGHWTLTIPSVTQYVVLETDSDVNLKTVLFDQCIKDFTTYKGLLDSYLNNNVTNLSENILGKPEHLTHITDEISNMNLSVQQVLDTPLWQLVAFPSEQIHSGGTFHPSCTYKFHMTIQRPYEEYLEWIK